MVLELNLHKRKWMPLLLWCVHAFACFKMKNAREKRGIKKPRRNATCLNIINWTYDSIIINAYMLHIIQFTYLHTRFDIILSWMLQHGKWSIFLHKMFSSFVGIYMHISSPTKKKFGFRFCLCKCVSYFVAYFTHEKSSTFMVIFL